MSRKNEILKRAEVLKENIWAMEDLYKSDKLWQQDYDKLQGEMERVLKYKGTLGNSSGDLLAALNCTNQLNEAAEKIYVYANQKLHEDAENGNYQKLASQAQSLVTRLSGNTSFIVPEILEIPEHVLAGYWDENQELSVYKKYLANIIRQKAHICSAEVEKILAQASEIAEAPTQIYSMFQNADLKFGDIMDENGNKTELTQGRYLTFLESSSQAVRKEAFTVMYKAYGAYKNTLAAMLYANVKQEGFFAEMRNYNSSLEAVLDGSVIPVSVYENLVKAVNEKLPLLHKYINLRKKILDLDELHMYDLYVPIVSDVKMEIPFEEAKDMVIKGLSPLGSDYSRHLKEGFSNRWIDVYENIGKRTGAYSWGAYGIHPYVLLNYQDNLKNVFTLAHEMGHALHSYYSDANQPYLYAGYKIFVAEVASTCNEALLIHFLMEQSKDNKEKAYLINYFLEQFRGTLYRQTMFAEFEKITHGMVWSGEVLTAQQLCDIYYDLNKKYYGEGLVIDEEIAMEWARIPHFYRPFYVYQYATGFSAAIAISSKILNGDQNVLSGYFNFLSSGSSMDPIDLLKLCGIDMTKPEPVHEALEVFELYLEKMKQLLDNE